jgi:hypothetical protein
MNELKVRATEKAKTRIERVREKFISAKNMMVPGVLLVSPVIIIYSVKTLTHLVSNYPIGYSFCKKIEFLLFCILVIKLSNIMIYIPVEILFRKNISKSRLTPEQEELIKKRAFSIVNDITKTIFLALTYLSLDVRNSKK